MKVKNLKILIITAVILGFMTVISNAATSASNSNIKPGETTTINITSNEKLGSYQINLTDLGGLEFVSVSSQGKVNGKKVAYAGLGDGITNLASYKVKAPGNSTNKTYKVSFSITAMEKPDGTEIANETITSSVTVTVQATPEPPTQPTTPTKSSDANLTNIITSPVDFKGFSSSKTSGYSVNEGTSDRINVSVNKSNSNSSINIVNKTNGDTGKKWVNLKEGENEIQITCTAEDGKTTKTYTIIATREKATNVENPIATTPDPVVDIKDATLKSLKIEGITFSPEFKSDVLQYTANLDDKTITKLSIEALANKTGAEVTIEGNSNLVAGTNAIKIKVTDGEETKTYTIVVTKAGGEEITNTVDENTIATTTEPTVTNKGPNMVLLIIIGIVALIVFAALISLIVTKIRFRKQNSSMDSISFTGFTSNDDETEQIEKPKKEKKIKKDDDDDDDGLGGTRRNGKHF